MVPSRYAARQRAGQTRAKARFGHVLGACATTVLAMSVSTTALAQDAAANASDTYRAVLQQTADVRTNTMQREFYIAQQEAEIARLRESLAAANSGEGAQADLLPMLRDMVAQLEGVMETDLPFRVEARFAALDNLRQAVSNDDAAVYDGFRRAFELAETEASYGMSVGYYTGNSPVSPGGRFAACQQDPASPRCALSKEQGLAIEAGATVEDFNQLGQLPDGNYIHYGRLALLYLERDSSEGYRYTYEVDGCAFGTESCWEPLPNSELLGLRQDVRIARGESAIATMAAPIAIGARDADDAS